MQELRGFDGQPVDDQPQSQTANPPEQLAAVDPVEPVDTKPPPTTPVSRMTMHYTSDPLAIIDGKAFPMPTRMDLEVVLERDVENEYRYVVERDRRAGVCVHRLIVGGESYELSSDSPDPSFVRTGPDPLDWEEQAWADGKSRVWYNTEDLVAATPALDEDARFLQFSLPGDVLFARFNSTFLGRLDGFDSQLSSGEAVWERTSEDVFNAVVSADVATTAAGDPAYHFEDEFRMTETVDWLPATHPRVDPSMTLDQLESCEPTEFARFVPGIAAEWLLAGVQSNGELVLQPSGPSALQLLYIEEDGSVTTSPACGSLGQLRLAHARAFIDSNNASYACEPDNDGQRQIHEEFTSNPEVLLEDDWLWIGDHLFVHWGRNVPLTATNERLSRIVDLEALADASADEATAYGWQLASADEFASNFREGLVETKREVLVELGEEQAWLRMSAGGWQAVTVATVDDCPPTHQFTSWLVGFDGTVEQTGQYDHERGECAED